jgi:hypothetical protein
MTTESQPGRSKCQERQGHERVMKPNNNIMCSINLKYRRLRQLGIGFHNVKQKHIQQIMQRDQNVKETALKNPDRTGCICRSTPARI